MPSGTLPRVGHTVRVAFCGECGNCEGTNPQAGCCRYCGVSSEPVYMNVKVESKGIRDERDG